GARAPVLHGESLALAEARRGERIPLAARYVRVLLRLRVDHLRHGPWRRHHRYHDLPRRVVLAEPRHHPAALADRDRGLPAGPLSARPVPLPRDQPHDRHPPERAPSAPPHPPRLRVRGRGIPISRRRAVGHPARELRPWTGRTTRARR